MTHRTADTLLEEVLKSYEGIDNDRTKEILISAIRHLFSFANTTSLTREEWRSGIAFLKAIGETCSDNRDEFVLLSDVLGLSALVEILSSDFNGKATPGSLTGPFHVSGSPFIAVGGSIVLDRIFGEQTVFVSGRVLDIEGRPISGATLDIWQTASNQLYAVQDKKQSEFNLRGKQLTDDKGCYGFKTVRPVPYPIPRDGPVGKILDLSERHGMRAAHIHIGVEAPGYTELVTEIFDSDDPYNLSDTVFGVHRRLVANYQLNKNSLIDADLLCNFDIVLDSEPISK